MNTETFVFHNKLYFNTFKTIFCTAGASCLFKVSNSKYNTKRHPDIKPETRSHAHATYPSEKFEYRTRQKKSGYTTSLTIFHRVLPTAELVKKKMLKKLIACYELTGNAARELREIFAYSENSKKKCSTIRFHH